MRPRGRCRRLRRQALALEQPLNITPVDFQPDQRTLRPAYFLFYQGLPADEAFLVVVDQFSQAKLRGTEFLRRNERLLAAYVVDIGENESGFDAGNIEGQHPSGMDVETASSLHQRVPHLQRVIPRNPDFVAHVAGVSRTGDVDWNAANAAAGLAEVLQIFNVGLGYVLQQLSRGGTLDCQRRHLLGNVLDFDLQTDGVLPKPAQVGIGGCPAITVFFQPRDGAVVDNLAFFVAPAAIDDLIDCNLVDLSGDDAVHESRRILTGDHVFVKWRDVDQRAGVADSVVFVLVVSFVDTDRVIPRPLAVVEALAKRKRPLMNGSSDRHSV